MNNEVTKSQIGRLMVNGATFALLACVAGTQVVAALPSGTPSAAQLSTRADVEKLIRAFLTAQRDRDVETLWKLTLPDYVEISPIGDVDDREAVLGFYAPEKAKGIPQIDMDGLDVRIFGGTAVAITRLNFTPPSPAPPGAVRVTYIAQRNTAGWRLASVQYTPIRNSGSKPR